MKNQFAQDVDYWIHKTKTFLHDPPDKAIHIPGHEERANDLLAAAGLSGSSLDKNEYLRADIIASGMDRATLPGYAKDDPQKNGAIDFCKHPAITHPTGKDDALQIKLPESLTDGAQAVAQICKEIQELLKEDLGDKAGSGQGLSEKKGYQGQEENFAPARFHYLYFILRRRLAQQNTGGLGGLWHRLPADTRLPDHSIWQHNGLVSALTSSFCLSKQNKASLMVFALTPVQDFVGRARKLRDYWSGSILLSWLAFEGIKAVIHELGADHILYPSLHGQPLIDGLLEEWQMDKAWLGKNEDKAGVASFPNKFVCLVPSGLEAEIAAKIEQSISTSWDELGKSTLSLLEKTVKRKDGYIREQFNRQLSGYWEYHWAAAPLVGRDDQKAVEELIHQGAVEDVFRFLEQSNALLIKKGVIKNPSSGEGQLYSVSHRLVQAMLAAGKGRRRDKRGAEEGIKCDMFGEFEILHYQEEINRNPKPSQDPFWQDLRLNWSTKSDFGKTERLCAIALVKRLAYRVCQEMAGHPLQKMFKNAEIFPSTTEMAMHDWWQQLRRKAKSQDDSQKAKELAEVLACFDWQGNKEKARQQLAQWFHEFNEPKQKEKQGHEIIAINSDDKKKKSAAREIFKRHKVKDIHKYYAVLMMDGDKMGKLINGETLGASWQNVLHPDLAERLKGDFDSDYKEFWHRWQDKKRFVSPAVHAAISEALGDFSLFTVPAIMKKYHGHLLYAGGDDVCAILPVSTVLDAAREIAGAYGKGFMFTTSNSTTIQVSQTWKPECGKLGLHLGEGENISISAGIMIAYHKKPLGRVISRTHKLLDMAKKEGGRNAFVLELDKRSGGGRIFQAKWHERQEGVTMLDHFLATANALKTSEQAAMSSSLAYRLATFETGLQALVDKSPDQLVPFIAKQLDRSGLNITLSQDEKDEQLRVIATHVAALINRNDKEIHQTKKEKLPLESLIVANFIGHCRKKMEDHCDKNNLA